MSNPLPSDYAALRGRPILPGGRALPPRLVYVLTLLALTAAWMAAAVVLGLDWAFWVAILSMWVVDWARAGLEPVLLAWMNRGLDSGSRATVLSMMSQSEPSGRLGAGRFSAWSPRFARCGRRWCASAGRLCRRSSCTCAR